MCWKDGALSYDETITVHPEKHFYQPKSYNAIMAPHFN